jgi:hypothetical protein
MIELLLIPLVFGLTLKVLIDLYIDYQMNKETHDNT